MAILDASWIAILLPAAIIAYLVRLEAILIGPYWSWLQLVPNFSSGSDRRTRQRALARRVAIPVVASFALSYAWPDRYDLVAAGVVAFVASALVLWPLAFGRNWDEVYQPRFLVVGFYALFAIVFVAGGVSGALLAEAVRARGGIIRFAADELISLLISALVVLFGTDGMRRVSEALTQSRDADYE